PSEATTKTRWNEGKESECGLVGEDNIACLRYNSLGPRRIVSVRDVSDVGEVEPCGGKVPDAEEHRSAVCLGRRGVRPIEQACTDLLHLYVSPPLRNQPQLRLYEFAWKQLGCFGVHAARVAALGFGANGVEVDEPRLEQRPRHRLERRVHLAVQLDLVVERAEDAGDLTLRGKGRHREELRTECVSTQRRIRGAVLQVVEPDVLDEVVRELQVH